MLTDSRGLTLTHFSTQRLLHFRRTGRQRRTETRRRYRGDVCEEQQRHPDDPESQLNTSDRTDWTWRSAETSQVRTDVCLHDLEVTSRQGRSHSLAEALDQMCSLNLKSLSCKCRRTEIWFLHRNRQNG